MGYIDNDFNNELESASHKKMTYPTVLYPYSLLEINRLQPSLPKEPQKPNEPRVPYKPSENYESPNSWGGCLVVGLIFLIVALIGGKNIPAIIWLIAIVLIVGGIYFINYNWKDKDKFEREYPEILAKYNIEMKQYQKEKQEYDKNMQEYKNQCLKYEKNKEEILSAHNVWLYRNKVMYERLRQIIKPFLNLTAAKKGVSESYFYSLLIEHFGGKIQTDLSFSQNEKTYFPDFIYYDSSTNLVIDIEIDEPYVGHSGIPIHYVVSKKDYYSEKITTSTVDDDRDRAINRGGWIIVKFAEQQVFEDAFGCIQFLSLVIENVEKMIFNCSNQVFLTPINRWTKDEAHGMGYKRFRFSYVPKEYHELLKVDGCHITSILATQEKMPTVETSIDGKTQTQMQNFALKYSDLFINIISNNYPLSYSLFEKYKGKLNWTGLSNNPHLFWSTELIEKYEEKWDWKMLTSNESLPWTPELLEKYKDKWDWTMLLYKKSILEDLWDCRQWRDEWCSKMKALWGENWEWKISKSRGNANKLTVAQDLRSKDLLSNESDEKASLVILFLDRDDTTDLLIKSRQWDTESFEKFKTHKEWFWKGLSANEQVTWSLEFIEKYMDKWNINELARNKSVYEIIKPHINVSLIDKIMTMIKENPKNE